jgi:TPP-dependent pyruvate/acetoin dehydrogenase alpha subunit
MDMIAIRLVRKWAVEVNGPPLLEFVTYRYGRHSYVVVRDLAEAC